MWEWRLPTDGSGNRPEPGFTPKCLNTVANKKALLNWYLPDPSWPQMLKRRERTEEERMGGEQERNISTMLQVVCPLESEAGISPHSEVLTEKEEWKHLNSGV